MSEISKCLASFLPEVLNKVLGIEKSHVTALIDSGKVKISPTPDPKLGDYGIAIHVVLKSIERDRWNDAGKAIANELYSVTRDKCWVEEADFVNGYVNVTINYSNMLAQLIEDFVRGRLLNELMNIGSGLRVIVEHTSANPIHPLHVGSGRNSVLGDTYAKLLRKLGFNVQTRFYVNDIGRQMATLMYGVNIVESKGVKRPEFLKIDHWYGVIYALTNVIIELRKLQSELRNKVDQLTEKASRFCQEFMSERDNVITSLKDLSFALCEISWKKNFKFELLRYAKHLYRAFKRHNVKDNPALLEIARLLEEIKWLVQEYRKFLIAERRLAIYYPELYDALRSSIRDFKEAEETIKKLMRLAESGNEDVLMRFRKIAEGVVEGFKQTLENLGIKFDGFDFESSSEILGKAHKIVEELIRTGYARRVNGGAVEVDLNAAARDHGYVRDLFYPDQAGRFVVQRSDGTTLYVTRDIAYTLYKFKDLGAAITYNVIAVEQAREQKQLKAVLHILGYTREAENLHHFAYEMVHLKGMRMSGRRGVYYTIDEMLVDSKISALQKLLEKESDLNITELMNIAEKLAIANTRALLLSVDPSKVLVFDPERISEVEYGTIIEYAFVRAQGVIRNLWGVEFLDEPSIIRTKMMEVAGSLNKPELTPEEKKLIEMLARFKDTLMESYREMKPNKLLEYAVNLAVEFNKFYEKHPVICERDLSKKNARIALTVLVLITLSELMDIAGIPKLKKM